MSTFEDEVKNNITSLGQDTALKRLSNDWIWQSAKNKYTYNFRWMGRPIIQFPQDMIAMQELIWEQKPDLIIETGVAHGGSLIFYASLLELIGNVESRVLGIDIEIRPHNRVAIESHPMSKRIKLIEGSSIDQIIVNQVKEVAQSFKKIFVLLDSNHTHEHVLKEMELYSPFVKKDSYLVVLDTIVEDGPEDAFPDRPWGKGNNPKTAVWEFLKKNTRFAIDHHIENKLLITVAPDGYLKCLHD